jgi:hypothetical protein
LRFEVPIDLSKEGHDRSVNLHARVFDVKQKVQPQMFVSDQEGD